MKYNKLGKNGPVISEIGFGSWAIGGEYKYGWGPSDDREAINAIHTAIDNGINWIDTAPIYGYGHSEIVIGKALKQSKCEMLVATKCGLLHDGKDNLKKKLSAYSIEKEIDESLKRLQISQIDIYQCHWPDISTPLEETWDCMANLVKKGKVRWIGVSNFSIDQLKLAHGIFPVTSLQPPYNLIRRDIEKEILPYCLQEEIGVIAYSPMQSGLLTGKFDVTKLSHSDWRLRKEQWYQEPMLGKHLLFVSQLREIAEKKFATVSQLAIAWVNRHEAISAAIVGARNSAQVLENLGAVQVKMDSETIYAIEQSYNSIYTS